MQNQYCSHFTVAKHIFICENRPSKHTQAKIYMSRGNIARNKANLQVKLFTFH